MAPRLKSSVLWGVIGGLSFLVLVQGYELLTGARLPFSVKLGMSGAVVCIATLLTYVADPILFGSKGRV